MTNLRVAVFIIVSLTFISFTTSNASIKDSGTSLLKLRSGIHPGFLRIVLEGKNEIISGAAVDQDESNLIVRFRTKTVKIKEEKKTPVSYASRDGAVLFMFSKKAKFRSFILDEPPRLVIDVLNYKKDTNQHEVAGNQPRDDNTNNDDHKGSPKDVESQSSTGKGSKSAKFKGANPKKASNKLLSTENFDDITVPERYKRLWSFYKSGNAFAILAQIERYEPEGVKELAIYHYLYGEAYVVAEQFVKAVEHLRLAFIYADDQKLKERALIRRAEIYEAMGMIYEARSNYSIFIKEFPDSKYIQKAHLGLANCLSHIGVYSEAVRHYEKAGNDAAVLYKKANALQKLERVKEARAVYDQALKADKYYPERSFETYYLMGENLRLLGRTKEARQHLLGIYYGPYYYSALISLGLIALDEAHVEVAIKYFKKATRSKKRKVRARAFFSLSFAYLTKDETDKAIESLEEIRRKYIDSELYKDALIALSKLYRKNGRLKDAIPLLKELVYGKNPPAEAFKQLEEIVLQASNRDEESQDVDISFLDLWREVKMWLIDDTREKFLLKVVDRLRYEGRPFIELCEWLIKKGSQEARIKAATMMADYFAGIGNVKQTKKYMTLAIGAERPSDDLLRVQAKVLKIKKQYLKAIEKFGMIKKIRREDLAEIGSLVLEIKNLRPDEKARAIAFYEEKVIESGREAEDFARLADILLADNQDEKAVRYYEMAYSKNPDDEWIMYQVGNGLHGKKSREIYARLQKGGTMLGQLAKARLFEMDLMKKMKEVY